jgi:hypothetical protein
VIRIVPAVLAVAVGLLVTTPAHADTIDDAVANLKDAPVYVAPGTEGTNSETAKDITQQLNDNDQIVVVMLPADAAPTDGNIFPLIRHINSSIGGKKIVALSTGQLIASDSELLPPGTASDLMERAMRVSTSIAEAHKTFIRNVHIWVNQHPEAVTTPASRAQPKNDTSGGGLLWVGLIGAVVTTAFAVYALFKRLTSPSRWDDFSSSPPDVRRELERVKEQRNKVRSPEMRELIDRVCRDTNTYYKRGHQHLKEDSVVTDLLKNLQGVLKSYLQVQTDIQENNKHFYLPDDANTVLSRHHKPVEDFAEYIRQSIRRGIAMDLEGFQFNADILNFTRSPGTSQ